MIAPYYDTLSVMNEKTLAIVIKARDDASKTISNVGDVAGRVSTAFSQTAKMAAIAGAAAVAAFSVSAIKNAADFEQSLNVFNSVSGATADQMKIVSDRAKELGNDMALPGISAKDAALAMVELSKAGISVNDTLSASKGVLALAKAGQLDTAEAAKITANALNAFSLSGTEASRVADILSAAANASSADVSELAYGFQMASSSFASVKAPVDDLATALALMSNNGIAGSDAGTSLKTMFMNLIPTTDRAKASMKALNLDFYDAKGNFVGLREMTKQLQEGTAKLTDEQKSLHIENIFGADSSRAVNILIKEGVKGYDDMTKAVNKTGAATMLAAAQNSGFKGALDNLQSTLETVGIEIGMKMLPHLTRLATTVSGMVVPAFNVVKDIAKVVITVFQGLSPIIAGVTAAFVAYQITMGTVRGVIQAVAVAQAALNAVMMANPVGLVIAGIVGLAAALAMVFGATNNAASAQDRLNQANINAKTAADALKAAESELTDARLAREGSDIAVQRAEERLNALKASGTASALDLKEAEYNLAVAKDTAKDAAERETTALNNDTTAKQNNKTATDELTAAQNAIASSTKNAADQYKTLEDRVNAASKAMKNSDMKTVVDATFGVGGIPNSKGAGMTIPGATPQKRAGGGSVSANQPYFVGDNPDGSLNRTTELFVPKTSGTIINSTDLQKALGNSNKSGDTTININGEIKLGSGDAVDRFFERLGAVKELGAYGVGV